MLLVIFTILFLLVVLVLYIETELGKCTCTYENKELKVIKIRNGQVVYRKIFKGILAKILWYFV